MQIYVYLREAAVVEEELTKEISDAPVFAVKVGRIGARRLRCRHCLLEGQSDGSEGVGHEIIRQTHHSLSLSLSL